MIPVTGKVAAVREGGWTPPSPGLGAEAILAQLDKIIANPPISRSQRLIRFLRFTVEQVLQGQGHRIKEYVLGVEVFDRAPSFDPRLENIVRVEARRLRGALIEYYATAGRKDSILIDFPKGTYSPVFTARPQATAEVPLGAPRPSRKKTLLELFTVGLIAATGIFWVWNRTQSGMGIPSVAVLPYVNLTGDPEQDYFTDGLTDEIIDALTNVEGLRVPARTSSFQFQQKSQDIRQIGEQLKVATVLEGSVRREGNRLRITSQLIKVADGYHVWSKTETLELKDVFDAQEKIARAIVQTLLGKSEIKTPLMPHPTENIEAHNLYMKGRYFWYKNTASDIRKGIQYFEQAIAQDAKYAIAWAGIADAYGMLGELGVEQPLEVFQKRDAAMKQALELDDRLAEAHLPLARKLAFDDRDWAGSEQEFRRIFELNPRLPEGHRSYGAVLLRMGRFDEAEREIKQAVSLDPLNQFVNSSLATVYYFQHRPDQVIEQCRKMLEMDAGFYRSYLLLGQAYEQKKMYPQAIEALQKATTLNRGMRFPLAYVYAASGQRREAERILRESQDPSSKSRVSPVYLAWVYLGLGEKNQALDWLEKAYADGDGRLIEIKVHPFYDSLHAEPRYLKLLSQLHLSR